MDRARTARRLAGFLAAGAVTGTIVLVVSRRAASRPARPARPEAPPPEWVRAFVARTFNPAVVRLGLVGGRRSPWSYVEHAGRRSGTRYRTPVLPIVADGHAYIPLPYGEDVNWARNARAAGHCRLQRHGLVYELDEPAIVSAREHAGIPAWSRERLERRGRRYLRLHVLATAPGSLDDVPAMGDGHRAPGLPMDADRAEAAPVA